MTRPSPLQNRVRPDGIIVATRQRGLFFGNRGGKIHEPGSCRLHPTKRWTTRQWICCVLAFKNRQRSVMSNGYTELFFMDEVAALAAGHRPCFECRWSDAISFAHAWRADGARESAPAMDRALHRERLDGRNKRMTNSRWRDLPVAAMIQIGDDMVAKSPDGPLRWAFDGYQPYNPSPSAGLSKQVLCLTPPSILSVLANGYSPHWHPSAKLS